MESVSEWTGVIERALHIPLRLRSGPGFVLSPSPLQVSRERNKTFVKLALS